MIYYLNADTGNDSTGDGSSSTPWLTISKAHTEASSGDTVVCQDSTATYSFVNNTFTKTLIIEGEQNDASGAVFDGGGNGAYWHFNGVVPELSKITFQNIATHVNGIIELTLVNGEQHKINNCVFTIDKFVDSNRYSAGSIYPVTDSGDVDSSIDIENCIFNITANALSVIFQNRIIGKYNITGSVVYISGDTVLKGLFVSNKAGSSYILKNCIVQNASSVTQLYRYTYSGTASQTITYSDVYGDFSDVPSLGTGTITSDPLFVDSANGNFNLRPSSPCFDTGSLI